VGHVCTMEMCRVPSPWRTARRPRLQTAERTAAPPATQGGGGRDVVERGSDNNVCRHYV